MIELEIIGIRFERATDNPVLMLKEVFGTRHLAMWIGPAEAMAIGSIMAGEKSPRPMTHDLLVALLDEWKVTNVEGRIVDVADGVFYGELEVDGHVMTARPSDIVAIAVRREVRLTVRREVMDQVGVELFDDGRDEVEEFRDFLADVNPEDFQIEPPSEP